MSEANTNQENNTTGRNTLDRKLDAIGWGLFFVWMGIAFLADVGWGVGFIGVGLIILGMLGFRQYLAGSACSGRTRARC